MEEEFNKLMRLCIELKEGIVDATKKYDMKCMELVKEKTRWKTFKNKARRKELLRQVKEMLEKEESDTEEKKEERCELCNGCKEPDPDATDSEEEKAPPSPVSPILPTAPAGLHLPKAPVKVTRKRRRYSNGKGPSKRLSM